MARAKLPEVVQLSSWAFAVWWTLFLILHTVVSFYNAVYAYYYWILHESYVEVLLEAFYVGMPPEYHHTISFVYAIMSGMHLVCILLMIVGSVWQRSLAFTPWSTRKVGPHASKIKVTRAKSTVVRNIYSKLSDRHGLFGVNGRYFHEIQLLREIAETSLQTLQAYRMSKFLPRTLLNRFYVVLLTVNCWSSVFVNSCIFKGNEARRRFGSIALDCALDLVACMGVELIIVVSYSNDFDLNLDISSYLILFNNEWMARAYNEFQMVVVVSWWDLVSRATFSIGLLIGTTDMKDLLQRLPLNDNQVAQSTLTAVAVKDTKKMAQSPTGTLVSDKVIRTINLGFGIWGALVLALHIHASSQPTLPQCLMQVRPWATSRPSCYLAGLDCHTLQISGEINEVDDLWSEFDTTTVVQMLIRHCPALEVPNRFTEFHRLREVKVYNTTIKDWGESAAITNTNHPEFTGLYLIRVNMTDGVLPAGFQSTDFPQLLYCIELSITNLRELPVDLDTKWLLGSLIAIEYSQLSVVPPAVVRLQPYYLSLTGNPITELPPEIFEIDVMEILCISNMNLRELPRNVTNLSDSLRWVFMLHTDISFFWSWADELVERMEGVSAPWIAGSSMYCSNLARIRNGSADGFQVSLSPDYSQTLMDSSETNLQVISKAVNCKPKTGLPSGEGMLYPLAYEDSISAISTPPLLM